MSSANRAATYARPASIDVYPLMCSGYSIGRVIASPRQCSITQIRWLSRPRRVADAEHQPALTTVLICVKIKNIGGKHIPPVCCKCSYHNENPVGYPRVQPGFNIVQLYESLRRFHRIRRTQLALIPERLPRQRGAPCAEARQTHAHPLNLI